MAHVLFLSTPASHPELPPEPGDVAESDAACPAVVFQVLDLAEQGFERIALRGARGLTG